jgi:UDPglucose--hexose-1-phosphate uridylyltransferase
MSEIRQDPITGRWVILAPARASRPWHIDVPGNQAPPAACPFCAGNEVMTPAEVWAERDADSEPNSPGWRVRVVTNKYPALENRGAAGAKKNGLYQAMDGLGIHEVIIESPEHVVRMSALGKQQYERILRAYQARLGAVGNDPRWRYSFIYKNHGERAGATFEHIHSQLVGLPFVPREAHDQISGARKHFETTQRCIYCDIIRRECELGHRVVLESEHFVVFCPYAPRFGYETWIVPKDHGPRFEQEREIAALGEMLRAVVVKLNGIADNPPFNYVIHPASAEASSDEHDHWHMEILPQMVRAAGFEWGTGAHMNSVTPERAARLLRDAPV